MNDAHPHQNIDFLLTNEPTQFNCFMNSVVQAIWHCKPANDALKQVQDLSEEQLTMSAAGKKGNQIGKLHSSREYQLVSHLQGLFDEAAENHAALQESLRIHASSQADTESTNDASVQSSQKGSKAGKSQQVQEKSLKQQDLLVAQDPLISPDMLRRELFKYYYATQNPEKFDLYKKADASEFYQSLLEMMHFCLNKNHKQESIDSFCG